MPNFVKNKLEEFVCLAASTLKNHPASKKKGKDNQTQSWSRCSDLLSKRGDVIS